MKESTLMTVREVAEHLRCHPATIYKLLKKRKIPAFKVGSDWRFNPKAIDQWLESQTNRVEVLSSEPTSVRRSLAADRRPTARS
jgi:excisionase family DNA binding protein